MLRIGLTGGVAGGKSEAASIFRKLAVPVIDADQIAREILQPGTPEYEQIKTIFGAAVAADDLSQQGIDRRKLRNMIFQDSDLRKKLENVLHPVIDRKMRRRLQSVKAAYCVLIIPLLVEKKMFGIVDKVVVVDCDEEKQIERTMKRDRCTRDQALNVMRAQVSRQERLQAADVIVENNASLEELEKKITALHHAWQTAASP